MKVKSSYIVSEDVEFQNCGQVYRRFNYRLWVRKLDFSFESVDERRIEELEKAYQEFWEGLS